jgi:hypothetical protein
MGAMRRNPLPSLQTQVHNANFLGTAVLYRANKYSGEKRFIAPGLTTLKAGYFYYQIQPYYKNKIPYMRWSQAWMLLALATLLEQKDSSPQSRRERRGG